MKPQGAEIEIYGSIGRQSLKSRIRILDAKGDEVPDGILGDVLVSGGNVASGHRRDEGALAEAFRDGWFHSRDIALRFAFSPYWFRDRTQNVIISGGENICPA